MWPSNPSMSIGSKKRYNVINLFTRALGFAIYNPTAEPESQEDLKPFSLVSRARWLVGT